MLYIHKCIFKADATKVGLLYDHMIKLLRKFLLKFVKSSVIAQHKLVTEVPYQDRVNQHDDDHLAIGPENRTFLSDNGDDIEPYTTSKFFRYILNINTFGYIIKMALLEA